ncbi:ribonuclease HI [Breoghania sp.]|uniref:ribonuclease HI n=1 Tax=Breoghania sp. TaxID=2065378 RepID=UPI002624A21B|nr:ribonuclease HI [Breoghania sp.]MDJ0933544.1 ribonuclease HI [Breoghania sp.]
MSENAPKGSDSPTTLPPVTIYTGGSCIPNPGQGGYAAILTGRRTILEISGGEPETTSNRMELTAVIAGLERLTNPAPVIVVSDSRYLIDGTSRWMTGWIDRHWKNVENDDLWRKIETLKERYDIDWRWIAGHSGHRFNERADRLAAMASQRQTPLERRLYRRPKAA